MVVDDDQEIVRAIAINLEQEGFQVFKAYDGLEALEIAMDHDLQLIIIDVMMPRLDGLSAVLKIREKKNFPIMILSAKSEDTDKVLGLSMGADDYLTKPFNTMELVARVKSQVRRYTMLGDIHAKTAGKSIEIGRLRYDLDTKSLFADGERVWNEPAFSAENTVMVHIRRIREKIELNPKDPEYLKVVWGIGYKIEKHGR